MSASVPAYRLPLFKPETLDADQRALYDAIRGGKRKTGHVGVPLETPAGELLGPFNAMLLSPKVGNAVQRVGEAVRFESALDPKLKELLILRVAAYTASPFEWHAHVAIARHQGMSENRITEIEARRRPTGLNPVEDAAWNVACEILEQDRVTEKTYAAAAAVLGQRAIFDVAVLVGYYRMLAGIMGAFDVQVHPAGD